MAMVSPSIDAFYESVYNINNFKFNFKNNKNKYNFSKIQNKIQLSSLKFANRAKNIKNDAKINEDVDQRALLR